MAYGKVGDGKGIAARNAADMLRRRGVLKAGGSDRLLSMTGLPFPAQPSTSGTYLKESRPIQLQRLVHSVTARKK